MAKSAIIAQVIPPTSRSNKYRLLSVTQLYETSSAAIHAKLCVATAAESLIPAESQTSQERVSAMEANQNAARFMSNHFLVKRFRVTITIPITAMATTVGPSHTRYQNTPIPAHGDC